MGLDDLLLFGYWLLNEPAFISLATGCVVYLTAYGPKGQGSGWKKFAPKIPRTEASIAAGVATFGVLMSAKYIGE